MQELNTAETSDMVSGCGLLTAISAPVSRIERRILYSTKYLCRMKHLCSPKAGLWPTSWNRNVSTMHHVGLSVRQRSDCLIISVLVREEEQP